MGLESYVSNQLEQQKKLLKTYEGKLQTLNKRIWMVAFIVLAVNLICLLAVPFISSDNGSTSFFEMMKLSDTIKEKYDLNSLQFVYILNWIATVAVAIITLVNYNSRNNSDSWVKSQIFCAIIMTVLSFILSIMHAVAAIEVSYASTNPCYNWRYVPMLLGFVYIIFPVMIMVYKKSINVLKNNIAQWEK